MSGKSAEKEEGKMPLLDIPEEVLIRDLCKFLNWNDLLRLRRVCKATKKLAHAYFRVNTDRAPEIEIGNDEKESKTFAAFNEMGIPTEKLFLNNPLGYRFYENEESSVRQFLEDYGPFVKHLRVKNITLFPSGRELSFIQGLKNLKTFEGEKFVFGPDHDTPSKAKDLARRVMVPKDWHLFSTAFPPIFKNLEGIRIGQDPEDDTMNKIKVTAEILMLCQKLKKASLPFTWTPLLPQPYGDNRGILMEEFGFLELFTKPRPSDVYSEPGILEEFDFENYHDNFGGWDEWRIRTGIPMHWFGSMVFLSLCQQAVKTGLKMLNVSPYWFYARNAVELEEKFQNTLASPELGIPVKSLMGIHPCLMTLEMPNLEKITIPHTSRCLADDSDEERKQPEWPSLKSLDITVDDSIVNAWDFVGRKQLNPCIGFQMQLISNLYDFLWKGVVRANLAELELKFVEGKWRDNGISAVPKTQDIVTSCPNLKKIKLANWPGKNKALLKLWAGLPGLEEVTLEKCREVGNVTFVGEDVQDPVFLKMKNLKKLTLNGLDQMPKITDLLFTLVLSKMKIKALVLTAEKPLEKITKEGINALLEGPFNEYVERFPFKDWSLAGVSAEEFEELGKKFRSYELL